MRVLGSRDGTRRFGESEALNPAEHDVFVSPAGHRAAVTFDGPASGVAATRGRRFAHQLALQDLAVDPEV